MQLLLLPLLLLLLLLSPMPRLVLCLRWFADLPLAWQARVGAARLPLVRCDVALEACGSAALMTHAAGCVPVQAAIWSDDTQGREAQAGV